ncbi:MAG: hypothetical protein K2F64_04780 [Muribaculaceae bacterium]|nr:hypothetical protein [Muribaculaceae bacterium]
MAVFLIILSILLWLAALAMLPARTLYAPALSYLGLVAISLAKSQGLQIIPVNSVILMTWLCMTVIVMLATLMQPAGVRSSSAGSGYMIGGALTGMMVGLLGFSFSSTLTMLYGIMVVATLVGTFFGFLLFSRTPAGAPWSVASGNFFRYLLAKGFPVAITVMMIGIVAVISLAIYNVH